MEALLIEIENTYQAICRTETNFKKLGKANINETIVMGRLKLLNERWTKAQKLDLRMHTTATAEEKAKNDYFKLTQFIKLEDAYLSALDFLNGKLHDLTSISHQAVVNTTDSLIHGETMRVKLPQVSLPEFSGKYNDWENFRHLFKALIIQNENLENVTRSNYLKTTLKGEAAQLLKHIPITNANFLNAWDILIKRYDNQRALIYAHIQSFMEIARVNNHSVENLKLLHDTTNEALAALKNLGRPVSE